MRLGEIFKNVFFTEHLWTTVSVIPCRYCYINSFRDFAFSKHLLDELFLLILFDSIWVWRLIYPPPPCWFFLNNSEMVKAVTLALCSIVKSLSFFRFMINLQPCGSRIPDARSIKLIFALTITFYLTKIENRTRKSLTQLSYYCFE